MAKVIAQVTNDDAAIYHGDCVDVVSGLPDDSVHYTIFSPPFASLYTHSNSDRDTGNCSGGEGVAPPLSLPRGGCPSDGR